MFSFLSSTCIFLFFIIFLFLSLRCPGSFLCRSFHVHILLCPSYFPFLNLFLSSFFSCHQYFPCPLPFCVFILILYLCFLFFIIFLFLSLLSCPRSFLVLILFLISFFSWSHSFPLFSFFPVLILFSCHHPFLVLVLTVFSYVLYLSYPCFPFPVLAVSWNFPCPCLSPFTCPCRLKSYFSLPFKQVFISSCHNPFPVLTITLSPSFPSLLSCLCNIGKLLFPFQVFFFMSLSSSCHRPLHIQYCSLQILFFYRVLIFPAFFVLSLYS